MKRQQAADFTITTTTTCTTHRQLAVSMSSSLKTTTITIWPWRRLVSSSSSSSFPVIVVFLFLTTITVMMPKNLHPGILFVNGFVTSSTTIPMRRRATCRRKIMTTMRMTNDYRHHNNGDGNRFTTCSFPTRRTTTTTKSSRSTTTTSYTSRTGGHRGGTGTGTDTVVGSSSTSLQMSFDDWMESFQKLFRRGSSTTNRPIGMTQQQQQQQRSVTSRRRRTEDTSIGHNDGDGDGTIIRLASRYYNSTSSKPSSRDYTTRKVSQSSVSISSLGIVGDYNHYRTIALNNTFNRAISIVTEDVYDSLRATYPTYKNQIQYGDLGENILLSGIPFTYFQIGQQYQFQNVKQEHEQHEHEQQEDNNDNGIIVIEITERIEPCANLCKLSYINDESKSPKERINQCQDFIQHLDRFDGYRGWYAKIISSSSSREGNEEESGIGILYPGAQVFQKTKDSSSKS